MQQVHRLELRITEEVAAALRRQQAATGCTASEYIRRLVMQAEKAKAEQPNAH